MAKNYTEKLILPKLHTVVGLVFEAERKKVDELKIYVGRLRDGLCKKGGAFRAHQRRPKTLRADDIAINFAAGLTEHY